MTAHLTCLLISVKVIELEQVSLIDMPNVTITVNITIPVQMLLSMKQKNFSKLFAAILKSALNFEHFEEKDNPNRFCMSGIMDSENAVN